MASSTPARKRASGTAKAVRALANPREGESGTAADRVIHERMRLAIVSALAVNESLTFTELRELLDTSDGNLSVHARKLEQAGYISCEKTFDGRTPRTAYSITHDGKQALENYLGHMETLIKAVRRR